MIVRNSKASRVIEGRSYHSFDRLPKSPQPPERIHMKNAYLLAICLVCIAGFSRSQTTQDLVTDGKNTENVITHSMGYDRKSFSPLKQINKSNVARLTPILSLIHISEPTRLL